MLTLTHFLTLGALLFSLSVTGIFLNRKNVIILLMCIELMLLAVNMNFIAFSRFLGNMDGQVFVFFILTVAAAATLIRDRRARPILVPFSNEYGRTYLFDLSEDA